MIDPWTGCPKCGTEGYHLFGKRYDDSTGEVVTSLEIVGEITVGFHREGELPGPTPVPAVLVDRELVADLVERECRACGHVWPQEIGRRVLRDWPDRWRCTCLRRIDGVSVTAPQLPPCRVHGSC